jgi:hypothetical protein
LFASALGVGLEIALLANPGGWPGLGFGAAPSPDYPDILAAAADPVLMLFFGGLLMAQAAVKEGVDRSPDCAQLPDVVWLERAAGPHYRRDDDRILHIASVSNERAPREPTSRGSDGNGGRRGATEADLGHPRHRTHRRCWLRTRPRRLRNLQGRLIRHRFRRRPRPGSPQLQDELNDRYCKHEQNQEQLGREGFHGRSP